MSLIRTLLSCLLIGALTAPAYGGGHQLAGRVVRIVDGDSLVLDVRGSHVRIELAGIDAPEPNQPWGPAAATALHRRLTGTFVVVSSAHAGGGRAMTGNIVAQRRDVALDLLYEGLAWSTAYSDPDADPDHDTADDGRPANPYTMAEAAARDAHRGLWSDPEPVPPWEWRGEPPPSGH